jgi:T-complex protein 1 subunit gamma
LVTGLVLLANGLTNKFHLSQMFGAPNGPVLVLSQNTKRSAGRKVQTENIQAGKTIGDVIRTCLGPKAMLKMLMDPMGGIVMTNDGNAILREITVQHPAAKTMIEIARTQDEEVGDGTTSVIVLAAEVLAVSHKFLEEHIHPTVIIDAYRKALEDAVTILREKVAFPVNVNDEQDLVKVVQSCIGTKFISR